MVSQRNRHHSGSVAASFSSAAASSAEGGSGSLRSNDGGLAIPAWLRQEHRKRPCPAGSDDVAYRDLAGYDRLFGLDTTQTETDPGSGSGIDPLDEAV